MENIVKNDAVEEEKEIKFDYDLNQIFSNEERKEIIEFSNKNKLDFPDALKSAMYLFSRVYKPGYCKVMGFDYGTKDSKSKITVQSMLDILTPIKCEAIEVFNNYENSEIDVDIRTVGHDKWGEIEYYDIEDIDLVNSVKTYLEKTAYYYYKIECETVYEFDGFKVCWTDLG